MPARVATSGDVDGMHSVRMSVLENTLSDASLITRDEYVEFLAVRGAGWLWEEEGAIVGFANHIHGQSRNSAQYFFRAHD